MASRITHLAIKSPRFFFLKCTFFNQSGAGKRMINIQLSKQKDNKKKILNSPSNPSTKQINTAINIRATDLLCSAWKCAYMGPHCSNLIGQQSVLSISAAVSAAVDGFEGEINIFSCCLFVSTTIYWSFFYLPRIDLKKVHLRKKNRGDLIPKWVIRDAMTPSFSFF